MIHEQLQQLQIVDKIDHKNKIRYKFDTTSAFEICDDFNLREKAALFASLENDEPITSIPDLFGLKLVRVS